MTDTFDAHDERTWSPALRKAVAALDRVTNPDEASYLLGYMAGAIEGIADAAGIEIDFTDLLDDAAAYMVDAGWSTGWRAAHVDQVPDPGLMIEDAAETASDGGEL